MVDIRTFHAGDSLPAFRIGDKLMISNPKKIDGTLEQISGIMGDKSLSEIESARKVAELVASVSWFGELAGRSDTHVTVRNLKTQEGKPVEPQRQTVLINQVIAVLQKRGGGDD